MFRYCEVVCTKFCNFFLWILVLGAPHLRDIFYRMGLSDNDIVALSGGHTLVLFFFTCFCLCLSLLVIDSTSDLLCWLWCYREGLIQRDQVLMALGPMNHWRSITLTLCKIKSVVVKLLYFPLTQNSYEAINYYCTRELLKGNQKGYWNFQQTRLCWMTLSSASM